MNNNKYYPATNKTTAIEPGFGIQFNVTAYNINNDVGWDRVRQKQRMTSLTNIPHATLARGNPCYFRCTMDANGNILSDNYVDTSMGNGYTWYYVGVAESATVINIDTTQSFFMTLDSNGKLTHINGIEIFKNDLSNYLTNSTVHITETYKSGDNWYRKYSDGWIEQGGITAAWYRGSTNTLTFNIPFTQRPTFIYDLECTNGEASEMRAIVGNTNNNSGVRFVTTTQATVYIHGMSGSGTDGGPIHWMACGY